MTRSHLRKTRVDLAERSTAIHKDIDALAAAHRELQHGQITMQGQLTTLAATVDAIAAHLNLSRTPATKSAEAPGEVVSEPDASSKSTGGGLNAGSSQP